MSFLSRLFRKSPPEAARRPSAENGKDSAAHRADTEARAQAAAEEAHVLETAIAAGDAAVIGRLVVTGSSTRIRQAAAHAVEDLELLRRLIREVRGGKDNSAYKVLTATRDRLLGEARVLEQRRAEIEATAAELERLARRPHDALFDDSLQSLEARWNAVAAHADAQLGARVAAWLDTARSTVAAHEQQMAEAAARNEAAARAAAEAESRRREQAQAAAEAAAAQQAALAEQRRAQADEQQAEQQAHRRIRGLIGKTQAALAAGSMARAAAARRVLDKALVREQALPENLRGQVERLDLQLAELQDWQHFSVAPKRAGLIEEMESLIGAPLDPPALAEKIRSLQEEWRALGAGAGAEGEAERQRFRDAGRKAYAPCTEYFAALAQLREHNLQQREALLARLAAVEAAFEGTTGDAPPDVRALATLLRETRQAWREHSPVDRKAGKPLQERYESVAARLQERLDEAYANNIAEREALIAQARQALAGEDLRRAIDAIKALQQKWRGLGPAPREQDQRLWETFRGICDAVFQKREQATQAHAAALEQSREQAVALCEQAERIAALEEPALQEQARALPGLRQTFEALGELPRADARALRERFDRAEAAGRAALARQHARAEAQAWDDALEAADRVRAARLAVLRPDSADGAAIRAQLEAFIAAVPRWPEHALAALQAALADEVAADPAENEKRLRLLCVRAEILTETPTPQEDQPLRRDYQLQQLVQGMGQGAASGNTSIEALAIDWIATGPVDEAVNAPLRKRFRACLQKAHAAPERSAFAPRRRRR